MPAEHNLMWIGRDNYMACLNWLDLLKATLADLEPLAECWDTTPPGF